jgi:hypothetical protein
MAFLKLKIVSNFHQRHQNVVVADAIDSLDRIVRLYSTPTLAEKDV